MKMAPASMCWCCNKPHVLVVFPVWLQAGCVLWVARYHSQAGSPLLPAGDVQPGRQRVLKTSASAGSCWNPAEPRVQLRAPPSLFSTGALPWDRVQSSTCKAAASQLGSAASRMEQLPDPAHG